MPYINATAKRVTHTLDIAQIGSKSKCYGNLILELNLAFFESVNPEGEFVGMMVAGQWQCSAQWHKASSL